MDRLTVSVFKGSVGLVFGFWIGLSDFGSGFGTRFLVSLGLDSVSVFFGLDLVFLGSGFGFLRIGFGLDFLGFGLIFFGSGFFFGQVLGVYFVWDIFDALTIQRCFSSAPFQNLFD
jgi:hypothetical protein